MTDDPSAAADFQLAGKRVLVTGAGQGVGEGIATFLAALGVDVVVNDLVVNRAEAVTRSIVAAGRRATALAFDVTDYEAVRTGFASAGPIDILVNNAGNAGADGFGALDMFVDTQPSDWQRYLGVNLLGVMNCTHLALPSMIASGWGRVITVVSDAARSGEPRMAAYSAAKAGATGLSRALAREVARHGVTVNVVSLGTMRTPLSEPLWSDPELEPRRDALLARYLVRRPGSPMDVAWWVAALASPRSEWVTGQTVAVNGGLSFTL